MAQDFGASKHEMETQFSARVRARDDLCRTCVRRHSSFDFAQRSRRGRGRVFEMYHAMLILDCHSCRDWSAVTSPTTVIAHHDGDLQAPHLTLIDVALRPKDNWKDATTIGTYASCA